jgi:hypothetical protein
MFLVVVFLVVLLPAAVAREVLTYYRLRRAREMMRSYLLRAQGNDVYYV